VNFRYTTAAFLVASGDYPTCLLAGKSPEPRASLCRANLPGDWALYAISVRRLIALHSDFGKPVPSFSSGTVPHGSAPRHEAGSKDLLFG